MRAKSQLTILSVRFVFLSTILSVGVGSAWGRGSDFIGGDGNCAVRREKGQILTEEEEKKCATEQNEEDERKDEASSPLPGSAEDQKDKRTDSDISRAPSEKSFTKPRK